MATTTEKRAPVRKELVGVVTSDKMDKSVVVRVDSAKMHPRYRKVVRHSKKFHAHDERNDAHEGDTVRIIACRPLSKTKTWRLVEVVERAK
jgi:small subunit ribosomal protein S17